MARKLLNQVRVATPCHVAWSEMQGDDRTRHCSQCKHNVYNLSDMSEKEAEAFIRSATGRTCIRYYQGTVMTRDCPVGLAAVRKRLAIGVLAAATLLVSAFGLAVRPERNGTNAQSKASDYEPVKMSLFDQAYGWLMAEAPEPADYPAVAGMMITWPRTGRYTPPPLPPGATPPKP